MAIDDVQVVEETEKCFLDGDNSSIQWVGSLTESANLRTQGTALRRIRLQTRLRKPHITLRDSNCSEEEASRSKVQVSFELTSNMVSKNAKLTNIDMNETNINKHDWYSFNKMQEKEDVSSSTTWQRQKKLVRSLVQCSSMVMIMAVIVVLVGMWKESRDAKCSFLFHQLDSFKGLFS